MSLRVSLPAGVRAGLYTLTLFAVADAASAQVYLLQGEPGPPGPEGAAGARGPAGVAAPAGLTRVVSLPPGDATCPRGGSQILAGTDRDGDGYLHDDEVETFSHSCHGDPGLDCADGACVLAADLEVEGAVYVSGPAGTSLPLVPHITTSVTFNIGPSAAAAFPTLQAALESLQGVRIALGAVVTLRLQAGEHVHAGALVLNHPDGRRIRIVGAQVADPSATVVLVSAPSATHGVVVQATDLGGLNGLTLRNASERGGHGVLVDDGRVVLGPALQIEGFDVGISAYHGAEVFLQGDVDSRVSVTGHVLGFFAQEASLHANFASATAPHAVEHTTGFHANLGGRIFAASAIAIGHSIGMLAHMQSVVHAPKAQVIGPGSATSTSGFLAQYGASIQAVDSVVHNVMFGYHAVYGGIIYVPTHGVATETPRLYCANTDSSVQRPGGPVVDCP